MECLQRQWGERGPRAFQDAPSPGWVPSACLGISDPARESGSRGGAGAPGVLAGGLWRVAFSRARLGEFICC